jgi:hypothetical protein
VAGVLDRVGERAIEDGALGRGELGDVLLEGGAERLIERLALVLVVLVDEVCASASECRRYILRIMSTICASLAANRSIRAAVEPLTSKPPSPRASWIVTRAGSTATLAVALVPAFNARAASLPAANGLVEKEVTSWTLGSSLNLVVRLTRSNQAIASSSPMYRATPSNRVVSGVIVRPAAIMYFCVAAATLIALPAPAVASATPGTCDPAPAARTARPAPPSAATSAR